MGPTLPLHNVLLNPRKDLVTVLALPHSTDKDADMKVCSGPKDRAGK